MGNRETYAKSWLSPDQERANIETFSISDLPLKIEVNKKEETEPLDKLKSKLLSEEKHTKSSKKSKTSKWTSCLFLNLESNKIKESKAKSKMAKLELNLESQEDRPLQWNSLRTSQVNKFYMTQKKIEVEEKLIEELKRK